MSDKPNPGEWQEHNNTPSLYVGIPHADVVEIFVEADPQNDEDREFAGILLTSGQARSVADKLTELADFLDTHNQSE